MKIYYNNELDNLCIIWKLMNINFNFLITIIYNYEKFQLY